MRFDAHNPNIPLPVHESKQIPQIRSRWQLGEEQLRPSNLQLAHNARLRRCCHNLNESTAPSLATRSHLARASKSIHPVPECRELQPSLLAELTLAKPAPLELTYDPCPMIPSATNVTLLLAHVPSIAASTGISETSPAERLRRMGS